MGNKACGKKRNFDNNVPPESQYPSASPSRKGVWKDRFDTRETKSNFFTRLINKLSSKSSSKRKVKFGSTHSNTMKKASSNIIDKGGGSSLALPSRSISNSQGLRSQPSSQLIQIYPKIIKKPIMLPVPSKHSSTLRNNVSSTRVFSSKELSKIYAMIKSKEEIPPPTPCIEPDEPITKRTHHIKKSEKELLDKLHHVLNSSGNVVTVDDLLKTIQIHHKESLKEQKPEPNLREFVHQKQAGAQSIPEIFDAEKNLTNRKQSDPDKENVSNSTKSRSGTISTATPSSTSKSTPSTNTSATTSSSSGSKKKKSKRKRSKSKERRRNKVKGKVLGGISFSTDKVRVDGKIVMNSVTKKAGADAFYLAFD